MNTMDHRKRRFWQSLFAVLLGLGAVAGTAAFTPTPALAFPEGCDGQWRAEQNYLTQRVSGWFYSRDGVNIRFKDTSGYYYTRYVWTGTTCIKQRLIDRRADYYQQNTCLFSCQMSAWTRYTSTNGGPYRGQPLFNQQNYGWDPFAKVFKVG